MNSNADHGMGEWAGGQAGEGQEGRGGGGYVPPGLQSRLKLTKQVAGDPGSNPLSPYSSCPSPSFHSPVDSGTRILSQILRPPPQAPRITVLSWFISGGTAMLKFQSGWPTLTPNLNSH